ncbi:MAG TPA: molybdate ABC transporter substrate-binding protein [Anaerolineaceae bacterium]
MRRKAPIFLVILTTALFASCAPAAAQPKKAALTVFAAASLTGAFQEIGRDFETSHPGVSVTFNFAGSQQLAQQIASGAPADVFASANQAQMDAAVKSGHIQASAARPFARNLLAVIYPAANPAGIHTLQDLARPGLKLVLADKSVPVGQYALAFLAKASQDPAFGGSYQAGVLKNVVSYEQDVKSVLAKVELGEADAGIVYTTDAAADTTGKIRQLSIPEALNSIAVYPIAAVRDSPNPQLAGAFVEEVLSPTGQAVLKRYGFIPPG